MVWAAELWNCKRMIENACYHAKSWEDALYARKDHPIGLKNVKIVHQTGRFHQIPSPLEVGISKLNIIDDIRRGEYWPPGVKVPASMKVTLVEPLEFRDEHPKD